MREKLEKSVKVRLCDMLESKHLLGVAVLCNSYRFMKKN